MNLAKLLIFNSRIPELKSSKAHRFLFLMEILSKNFEVHYLTFQTLFLDSRTVEKIEGLGIKIVNLKRVDSTLAFDKRLQNFFESEKFKIILFDSVHTAKYYFPYINKWAAESILIMDVIHSQYLMELKFIENYQDENKKNFLIEKNKITGEKELPIYNYFDRIIVNNKNQFNRIKEELPNVEIGIIPEELDNKTDTNEVADVFSNNKKRIPPGNDLNKKVEIKKINLTKEQSIIERYNFELKNRKKEYTLLIPDTAVIPENFVERLLICMESHPDNAIVSGISNQIIPYTTHGSIPSPENSDHFNDFLDRHFVGNFGEWRKLNYIREFCFLIKNKLAEQIGLLDTRFRSLEYALMDLSLRILQAGYRIILNQEAFIYYKDIKMSNNKYDEFEQRILVDKWGIDGAEILENLQ